MIDVAWNPHSTNFGKLAVSTTSGHLSLYDCTFSLLPKSKSTINNNPNSIWEYASTSSRSIHKITWSLNNANHILTANQDGIIRLFDTRIKINTTDTNTNTSNNNKQYYPRGEAIRDIQFDPHNSDLFAAVTDNGSISIWDIRYEDTAITKFIGYTKAALCIAYHPSQRDIIITGGKDKYLKLWNISGQNYDHDTSHNPVQTINNNCNNNTFTSISIPTNTTPPPLLLSIKTSGSVDHVYWRGQTQKSGRSETLKSGTFSSPINRSETHFSTGINNFHESQIAISSLEKSEICIYNLNYPSIPVCILRGHNDVCTGIAWVDTPVPPASGAAEEVESAWKDSDTVEVCIEAHMYVYTYTIVISMFACCLCYVCIYVEYIFILSYLIILCYVYVTCVEVPPYLSRRQAAHVIRVQGRAYAVTGLSQCVLS